MQNTHVPPADDVVRLVTQLQALVVTEPERQAIRAELLRKLTGIPQALSVGGRPLG